MSLIKNAEYVKSAKYKTISRKVPIIPGAVYAEITPLMNSQFCIIVYVYGVENTKNSLIVNSNEEAEDYCIKLIMEKDNLFK
jgi:hypothetical protein